jgi:hypothetical protein
MEKIRRLMNRLTCLNLHHGFGNDSLLVDILVVVIVNIISSEMMKKG